MTERAAFEEWAKPRLFNLRRMKDYPDQYLDLSTECGWQAWQAAPNEREARMLTGEERRDVARGMDPAHTTWLLSDWPCARLYSTAVIRKFCEVNGIALAEVAGGDQKAAPVHPSSVQAVDGDEPVAWKFPVSELLQQALDVIEAGPNAPILMNVAGIKDNLRYAIRAAMKDKGHDN